MRSNQAGQGQDESGYNADDNKEHEIYRLTARQFILYLSITLIFGMGLGALVLASFVWQ